MDNVVQNININDIIPGYYQPTNEERRKIEELVQSIRHFGLLEPILVRPNNNKYEIVSGMDKYQAAIIAKLTTVPVVIKKENAKEINNLSNIDNNQAVSLNTLPTNTFYEKEKNSDVVNLSELSKIKLEYERDDLKMNNGQFNNDMIKNNLNQTEPIQTTQGPTFGGRFFPSLEDEPTNMNMMENLNQTPVVPNIPVQTTNELNNNLIDLTDLSVEKEPIITQGVDTPLNNTNTLTPETNLNIGTLQQNEFSMPQMEEQPMPTQDVNMLLNNINTLTPEQNLNIGTPQQNEFSMPQQEQQPMPFNDNIINLDTLQNNNPAVQPIKEPVSMEILNADFGAPQTPNYNIPNQFDVPQTSNLDVPNQFNIPQTPNFDVPNQFGIPQTPNFDTQNQFDMLQQNDLNLVPTPDTNLYQNSIQSNMELTQPLDIKMEPQFENMQQIPNFNINQQPVMQPNFESVASEINYEEPIATKKDVSPVTNTIKNIVNSLEAFGYKINLNEEESPNVSKIIIEIEK